MRDIARSFASGRRITGVALTALATIATVAALAPSAMAASPVTIKTSFENTPISLATSDAIGYAFTNTSGASQNVTFTDTLPAGVTLDNPIGTTLTNGSSSGCSVVSSTAAPGASSLTVTITVPSATSTVCTLSYSIVATAPSNDVAISDAYSAVSTASATAVGTTAGSLTVLSSPSLSFTAPTNGQSFSLGQVADAAFACTATDPKDSIDSFFGTDDEGNQIESGAPIDTVDPGSHTLEVDCYSAAGGGDVTQTINYTVGSYTLSAVKAAKTTDRVTFKTTVPAGKLVAKYFYGKKVIGHDDGLSGVARVGRRDDQADNRGQEAAGTPQGQLCEPQVAGLVHPAGDRHRGSADHPGRGDGPQQDREAPDRARREEEGQEGQGRQEVSRVSLSGGWGQRAPATGHRCSDPRQMGIELTDSLRESGVPAIPFIVGTTFVIAREC